MEYEDKIDWASLDPVDRLTIRTSPSRTECYIQCPAKFYFRYIERLPKPKFARMVFGSGMDHAQTWAFGQVMNGNPLPDAQEIFDETAEKIREKSLAEPENGVEGLREEVVDDLVALAKDSIPVWRRDFATQVVPMKVQQHVSIDMGGWVLHGFLDSSYVDKSTGEEIVGDLKTSGTRQDPGRAKPENDLWKGLQPVVYTGATGINTFEYVVLINQKKGTRIQRLKGVISDEHRKGMLNMARTAREAIRRTFMTGADFMPNRTSMMCSRRYCDACDRCEAKFGGTIPD